MSPNQILLYFSFVIIILLVSILITLLIKIRKISHTLHKINEIIQTGNKDIDRSSGKNTINYFYTDKEEAGKNSIVDSAEELINGFRTRIKEESQLTDLTLDNIMQGILVLNHNKEIIKINENLLNLFYLKKEDVLNKKTVLIFNNVRLENLISGSIDKLVPQKEDIIFYGDEDKHLRVEVIPFNLESQHDDGRDGGRKASLLVLFKNITGEMEFSKLRSQFVANISHEMRTPVTSIRGYIDTILEDDLMDRSRIIDYLKKSLIETDRLNYLIKDVLNLSNIEYRRNVLFEKEYNLINIIKETIKSVHFLAEKNDIEINLKSKKDIINYHTDEELFSQMVRNIIENSIFYGGKGIEINIDITENDNDIVLLFEDNGAGIEKEDVPYIFQRFYRGKSSNSSKQIGSGLGLSIVKHTVELHRGKIDVRSVPGKSTVFRVVLPKNTEEELKR
ncbi:MAG: ATP-binding protein [Actinomycetota bacterium]|nr:ATP-binding protein [Actinomycetota bacterium]